MGSGDSVTAAARHRRPRQGESARRVPPEHRLPRRPARLAAGHLAKAAALWVCQCLFCPASRLPGSRKLPRNSPPRQIHEQIGARAGLGELGQICGLTRAAAMTPRPEDGDKYAATLERDVATAAMIQRHLRCRDLAEYWATQRGFGRAVIHTANIRPCVDRIKTVDRVLAPRASSE